MQHPDEGTIHSWLDGQLSAEAGAEMESHVATCPDCAAIVAEARGLIAASSRIVSALDTVPGGVMPARAGKRPWYLRTQVRAAAAVLFVAGASMVLFRVRDSAPLDESASRVLVVPGAAVQEAAESASDAGLLPAEAAPPPPPKRSDTRLAPPRQATTTKARTDVRDAAEPSMAANQQPEVNEVVVTGVTVMASPPRGSLKILRADTTGNVTVTVYSVASGIEVILTESAPAEFAPATAARRERKLQATVPAPPPPPPPSAVQRADMAAKAVPQTSIFWTDPVSRRTYILSGPLPRERLEELRKEIEQTKP